MSISMNTTLHTEIKDFFRSHFPEVLPTLTIQVEEGEPTSPKYPLVIITEISNNTTSATTDRSQFVSAMGYEFNIYAKNIGAKTKHDIAREIADKIDSVMVVNRFTRVAKTTLPTIDTTLTRIVLRYNAQLFNNRNRLY